MSNLIPSLTGRHVIVTTTNGQSYRGRISSIYCDLVYLGDAEAFGLHNIDHGIATPISSEVTINRTDVHTIQLLPSEST